MINNHSRLQVVYGLISDRRQELEAGDGPPRTDLLNSLLVSVDDEGRGALLFCNGLWLLLLASCCILDVRCTVLAFLD